MAIVLDTSVTANGNGVNSFAFGALTTVKQSELLVCMIHLSSATPSGITFDGTLTWYKAATEIALPGAGGELWFYYAKATQPLKAVVYTATFTGGGFPQCSGIISAWQGVNMASPIGAIATQTDTDTSMSQSVTTTKQNSLVIATAGMANNTAITQGGDESEVTEVASAGGFSRIATSYQNAITTAAGTSVTMDYTTTFNANWAMYAVELIDGSRPSIITNNLRPAIFSPGITR